MYMIMHDDTIDCLDVYIQIVIYNIYLDKLDIGIALIVRLKHNTNTFVSLECPTTIQSHQKIINETLQILSCTSKDGIPNLMQWETCDGNSTSITQKTHPEFYIVNKTKLYVNSEKLAKAQCLRCRLCQTAEHQFIVFKSPSKATDETHYISITFYSSSSN